MSQRRIVYDAYQVLARVDTHVIWVLALGGLTLISNYVLFIEWARLARRDRCSISTLMCVTLLGAHDGSFVLRYDTWFHTYHHWLMELFWVGLVLTFAWECYFFGQIIKYGREEMAPQLSQRGFTAYCLAAAAAAAGIWGALKAVLNDPLYAVSFMFTITIVLPAAFALMMRRRSRRGQSMLAITSWLGVGVFYTALTIGIYRITDIRYQILAGVTLAWGIGWILAFRRQPEWSDNRITAETHNIEGERGGQPAGRVLPRP
jgi:hypothetical protein